VQQNNYPSDYSHEYENEDNFQNDEEEVPVVDSEFEPHFTTSLEVFNDPNKKPLHVQALNLDRELGFEEITKRTRMLTSYIGVPTLPLADFVNMKIEIVGAMIYHVDYFTSKITGQREPGYDVVYIKLAEKSKDRVSGDERNVIVECNGKYVFELARAIWLDMLGWYDWPGSVVYRVSRGKNNEFRLQQV